jgi:hypothetical protein
MPTPKKSDKWVMIEKHTGTLPQQSKKGIWIPMAKVGPRAKEKSPDTIGNKAPVHGVRLKSALREALKSGTFDRFESSSGEGIWIPEDTIAKGPDFTRRSPDFIGQKITGSEKAQVSGDSGPDYTRLAADTDPVGPTYTRLARDIGPDFPRIISTARCIKLA